MHWAVTPAHSPRQTVGTNRGEWPWKSAGERGLRADESELAVSGAVSEWTLSCDRRRSDADVLSGRGGARRREDGRGSSIGIGLTSEDGLAAGGQAISG